jgi:hercynylcysteine S-oxide lyase
LIESTRISTTVCPAAAATSEPADIALQGSFGTYPAPVRNVLHEYQALSEAGPDNFQRYISPSLLDAARASIAELLSVPVEECVFVQNASSAVGIVLRNLVYEKRDVIIYFDTIYGACEKLIASIMETNSNVIARKVLYELPCMHDVIVSNFVELVQQVRNEGLNPKVALFDTIVSMPGVRFPFERLTAECKKAGILSCVDGAHGVGHLPLDLRSLDADFFVSNCHK